MATIGGTSAQKVNAIRLSDVSSPVPAHSPHSSPPTRPVPSQVEQTMLLAGASASSAANANRVSMDTTMTTSVKMARILRLVFIVESSK